MTEWLENDDDKNELLKLIDEMKAMSSKQSNRVNPLLSNTSNSTLDASKNSLSYDDLVLFDEILSAEVNKTHANAPNADRLNGTAQILLQNAQQSHSWNAADTVADATTAKIFQKSSSIIDDKSTEPIEIDTKTLFDAQQLIERIRRSNVVTPITPNYEILTCKSQSFLQRLAVLGEMVT